MGFGCPDPANGTNDFSWHHFPQFYTHRQINLSYYLALLVSGLGNYSVLGPAVCNISPKITSVKFEYGPTVRTTIVNPLVTNDPDEIMVISRIAMGVLQRSFLHGQNLNANDVGDAFGGALINMNSTAFQLEPFNQELLVRLFKFYFHVIS